MLGKEIKWTKSFKQTSSNSDEYWEDLKLQIRFYQNKINKPNSLYSFKSKWYENWVFEQIGGYTSVIFRITEQCETLNNWQFFENTGGAKSLQNFKFYKILSTQYFIYLWVSKSTRKIAICNIPHQKHYTSLCNFTRFQARFS